MACFKMMIDIPPEKFFYANDGSVIRNLHELPEALRSMSKETFVHHVNSDRNDFYNWALDQGNHG
jgi:hypothetical protein